MDRNAVAMTESESLRGRRILKTMADFDLIFIVQDAEGNPAGISLPLPDLNQALIRAYPRPGVPEIWSMLKMLWHWKIRSKITIARIPILGVLEPYRGRGVAALLMYETARAVLTKGYEWSEMSWLLETNDMINRPAKMINAEVYKVYRLYQKPL